MTPSIVRSARYMNSKVSQYHFSFSAIPDKLLAHLHRLYYIPTPIPAPQQTPIIIQTPPVASWFFVIVLAPHLHPHPSPSSSRICILHSAFCILHSAFCTLHYAHAHAHDPCTTHPVSAQHGTACRHDKRARAASKHIKMLVRGFR
jgi:hypothetical protein